MPQVDFYLLTGETHHKNYGFTCRLIEKIYQLGHQQCLLCQNEQQQQRLDDMLWTFKDDSFVPHVILNPDTPDDVPIILATAHNQPTTHNVLVNFTEQIPENAEGFERIIELVPNQNDSKQRARARYQHYKDQDMELKTHHIS